MYKLISDTISSNIHVKFLWKFLIYNYKRTANNCLPERNVCIVWNHFLFDDPAGLELEPCGGVCGLEGGGEGVDARD